MHVQAAPDLRDPGQQIAGVRGDFENVGDLLGDDQEARPGLAAHHAAVELGSYPGQQAGDLRRRAGHGCKRCGHAGKGGQLARFGSRARMRKLLRVILL